MSKRIQLDPIIEEPPQGSSMGATFLDYLVRSRRILQIALLVVGSAGAFLVCHAWYRQKQERVAEKLVWRAQRYYEEKDYEKALQGEGLFPGFISITQTYGKTKAGQLAYFYIGLIYHEQKKYQDAIQCLQQYNRKDPVMQVRVWGLLGDLYVDMDNYQEALIYYEKAINHMPNRFTTPKYLIRAAEVYEQQKDYVQAVACYEKIIVDFPTCEQYTYALTHKARIEARATQTSADTPVDQPTT